jgi:hypothetical protein
VKNPLKTKRGRACILLRQQLSSGPKRQSDLLAGCDCSPRTFVDACKLVGVQRTRLGYHGPWVLRVRPPAHQDGEVDYHQDVDHHHQDDVDDHLGDDHLGHAHLQHQDGDAHLDGAYLSNLGHDHHLGSRGSPRLRPSAHQGGDHLHHQDGDHHLDGDRLRHLDGDVDLGHDHLPLPGR